MLSWRFSLYRRARHPRHILAVLFGALFAAECGGLTAPSLGPILVCPAPVTVQSADGNASLVTYDLPQVIAGEPPLRTTCAPPSGSIFPVGATTVICSTIDFVARTDDCTFTVTVTTPPHVAATTFMAFGNSITEGKTAAGFTPNNYPEYLRGLLRSRYTAQTTTVVNRGLGGEWAVAGAVRIQQELDFFHPGALLIEEGINDLDAGESNLDPMVGGLRDIVRAAKGRGVHVFLATLLPQREGGSRAQAVTLLRQGNTRIRQVAVEENVTLVDLYQAFNGSPDPYIDVDGLHPTEAGHLKIAEMFFDAIKSTLEGAHGVASFGIVRNMPSGAFPLAGFH